MATPLPINHARFTLAEIAEATGGRVVGDPATEVIGVFTDSRNPQPEGIFVALEGDNFDGHAYARDVEARAVLVRREDIAEDRPRVIVADTIEALGAIAQFHRIRWAGPVVAITGSVGKTTTREFTEAALTALGHRVCATTGNLNNLVGLPLCVLCLDADHEFGVFEAGTSEPGEIEALGSVLLPNVAVITAIGVAHSEGLGDLDAIREEKLSLLYSLEEDDAAVLAADDELLHSVPTEGRVYTYGIDEDATVRIVEHSLMLSEDGVSFRRSLVVQEAAGRLEFHMRRIGGGAGLAAAAAITVLRALSQQGHLSGERLPVRQAFDELEASVGRMRVVRSAAGVLVVDDCYNASPKAVKAGLIDGSEIAGATGGRMLAVLGDMKELGELSAASHAGVVKRAEKLGYRLIAVGPEMGRAARASSIADAVVDTAEEAIVALADWSLASGDVVLVKGSRSVGLESVVERLVDIRKEETA